ncbi:MAG: hypothetical protein H6729_02575 [Deltaproteobacteria bacterium]|nr:hypothetical protein [Deltaproteobacteria bacterium]
MHLRRAAAHLAVVVTVVVAAIVTNILAGGMGLAKTKAPQAHLVFERPECTAPMWRPPVALLPSPDRHRPDRDRDPAEDRDAPDAPDAPGRPHDNDRGQLACIVAEGPRRGLVVFSEEGATLGIVPGVVRRFWWSPDGTALLSEQIVSGRIPMLFLTDARTFETKRLLHPPRRVDGTLGFGPSPHMLWFEVLGGSLTDRDTYLSRSPIEGGHPDEPLHLRGTAFTPSPRGDIAFLRTTQHEGRLFVSIELKRPGTEETAIGPVGFMPKTFGDVFAWSVDGQKLAVRGTIEGNDTWLHVLDIDDPERKWTRIALVASMSAGVAWAPDGRGLAYQGYRLERRPKRALSPDDLELRYVDLTTQKTRALIPARHGCAFWTPTWSTSGLAAVFDCSTNAKKKRTRMLRVYRIDRGTNPSRRQAAPGRR